MTVPPSAVAALVNPGGLPRGGRPLRHAPPSLVAHPGPRTAFARKPPQVGVPPIESTWANLFPTGPPKRNIQPVAPVFVQSLSTYRRRAHVMAR